MASKQHNSGDIAEKKTFLLITGGSRGFGKSLALGFATKLGAGSLLVLVARDADKLEATKVEINSIRSDINVITITKDLGNLDSTSATELLKLSLESTDLLSFEKAILIHNVGSLGSISETVDNLDDIVDWKKYFDLNVLSVFVLNAAFLKTFQQLTKEENKCFIINVSSLAALNPFAGWAQYCTGKAARDSYFKVCATELPNIRVLNYSPGPMETEMTGLIIERGLPAVSDWFVGAKAKKQLVDCRDSVKKLLVILEEGNYVSGEHIDYFD